MKSLTHNNLKMLMLAILVAATSAGCVKRNDVSSNRIFGYKPIYSKSGKLDELIQSTPAKNLTGAGKIYTKGNLLLVVDPGRGIHVINNTDPSNPINTSYITVPGALDVAIKDNYLYADYLGDMAIIDISNINDPKVKKSTKINTTEFKFHPPKTNNTQSIWWSTTQYFECVDESKGTVIGWQYTELINPKCFQ